MDRKGISPLIAAVLLIAFTMAIAAMFAQWAPQLMKNAQGSTSNKASNLAKASNMQLKLEGIRYNRSTNNLSVTIQNEGAKIGNKTDISISLVGSRTAKNKQYPVDLKKAQIKTLQIPTQKTYPLTGLRVSLTNYPVTAKSKIKCTPTKGLKGYWTFNKAQTKNGYAIDLSGNQNNGVLKNGVNTNAQGIVGGGYRFNNYYNQYVDTSFNNNLQNFTLLTWIKWNSLSKYKGIFSKTDGSGYLTNGWRIQTNHNNKYEFLTRSNGKNAAYLTSPKPKIGKWQYLTIRYNHNKNASIFLNGQKTATTKARNINYTNVKTATIGSQEGGYGAVNATMDEVRIYNGSLTQPEIKRLYNIRSSSWAINACKLIS